VDEIENNPGYNDAGVIALLDALVQIEAEAEEIRNLAFNTVIPED